MGGGVLVESGVMALAGDGDAQARAAELEFVVLPLQELSCSVPKEIEAMAIRTKALFMS